MNGASNVRHLFRDFSANKEFINDKGFHQAEPILQMLEIRMEQF